MNIGKWIAGGAVGGLIGAAVWAGVAYTTHHEVGWIAWGVGFLVGFGVRLAAGETHGGPPGVTAVGIAFLSILVGKFAAVWLVVSGFDPKTTVTPQDMISSIADDIVKERTAKGKRVNWPPGMSSDKATEQKDYPADIWQEASKRWEQFGPVEQARRMAEQKEQMERFKSEFRGTLRTEAFKHSFSPFDILWFMLAAFTAFKIGSGLTGSER
jgi:hypothetical protein